MYATSCGQRSSSFTSFAQSSVYASTKSATVTLVADDERASLHVLLGDVRHSAKILARERNVRGQPLLLRIQILVLGDAPQRLLQLRHREQQPPVDLRAAARVRRQELPILLREVQHDRCRLGEHEIAVDQHRDLGGRIELQKLGPRCLAGEQVHADRFEVDAELLQRPAGADRAREREFIQLHGALRSDESSSRKARSPCGRK